MRPSLLVTIGLAAMLPPQQPTIRVPVRLVSVRTLVFSPDSRLLPNLQSTDFRVLDNGRPQSFTVEEAAAPLSVAVVVQTNQDVRQYVPFIAKSGSVIDAHLV